MTNVECCLFKSFVIDRVRCKFTVEVSIENERFTLVCSRCCLNLKFGDFTFSFGRLRQVTVLRCVPHVLHGYLSSFNQSDNCFLASSLLSPLSLL